MIGKAVIVVGQHVNASGRVEKRVMSYLSLSRSRKRLEFFFANQQIEAGLKPPDAGSFGNEFLSDQPEAVNGADADSCVD